MISDIDDEDDNTDGYGDDGNDFRTLATQVRRLRWWLQRRLIEMMIAMMISDKNEDVGCGISLC